MSPTDDRAGLRLDPDTQKRVAEAFQGRSCCRCDQPAVRMIADRFYCASHYARKQRGRDAPKVYRCVGAPRD